VTFVVIDSDEFPAHPERRRSGRWFRSDA